MTKAIPRALFVRTRWMKFYDGDRPDDPKPERRTRRVGKYLAHEIYNFHNVNGYCRGAFDVPGRRDVERELTLERIDPEVKGGVLEGVTVVFVAPRPGGGQVVVGWYRNATVYRRRRLAKALGLKDYGYYCRAHEEDAIILPVPKRRWRVPRGHAANTCYMLYNDGTPMNLGWQRAILKKIETYDARNSSSRLIVELEKPTSQSDRGQGRQLDKDAKDAIENWAMEVAKRYFEEDNFVEDRARPRCPHDLLCSPRDGSDDFYVEVKGTTGSPNSVTLTANEVAFARKHRKRMVLFIVSDINLDRATNEPSGGQPYFHEHWCPDERDLTPTEFNYRVPRSYLKKAKT